nr:hypothetical protein Iba_chr06cCG12240 [Ipomoea batatas]
MVSRISHRRLNALLYLMNTKSLRRMCSRRLLLFECKFSNTLQFRSHPDALVVRLRILIANSFKWGVEAPKEVHQSTVKFENYSKFASAKPNKPVPTSHVVTSLVIFSCRSGSGTNLSKHS